MSVFKQLVSEAHRRSVWQVLGIYLVGAWAGWEVIGEITDRVGLPDWVPAFALVLLIIGLPIVVATAIVQEGTPLGRPPEPPAPPFQPADPTLLPISEGEPPPQGPAQPASRISIDYGRHHWMLTWPKAIASGLIGFVLLGVTAGGYMGMRNAGIGPFGSLLASGAIENRERIIIADFRTTTSDSSLAQAVTEAFRVDLAQTPTVTIVEPAHIRLVLARMSHEPTARLDADLARDVAIRDNIKALVAGEISAAGGKYVVAAKLVNAKDASVLASFRETAADSSRIIDAVDKLSRRLREKLGESLRTIRAEKPLEAVSTPSLEALLKYTQANYAVDTERNYEAAISLLEEALAIDSTFGMAWRKLAVAYSNSGAGRDKVVAAGTKAYEYRDRMTDIERYHALGYYYYSIKNDRNKAISAYEMLLDRDPNFVPNNLGLAYRAIREYDKAVEAFREAIRRDSMLASAYDNLFNILRERERLGEAEEVLQMHARRFPNAPETQMMESELALARRDYAAAEAKIRELAEVSRSNPMWRFRTSMVLANYARARGQLAAAERLRAEATAAQVDRGNTWAPIGAALERAEVSRFIRLDTVRARRELEQMLATYRLDDIPPLQRPYLGIAWQYALDGDARNANAFIAAWERNVPPELRGDERETRNNLDLVRAVAERRADDAVAAVRRIADFTTCEPCWAFGMAHAFELANQLDSAAVYYERTIAGAPWSAAALATRYPYVHERLAQLYEQQKNAERARLHAAKFVEFWEKADPELQPRVQAMRTRLQRLSPDR